MKKIFMALSLCACFGCSSDKSDGDDAAVTDNTAPIVPVVTPAPVTSPSYPEGLLNLDATQKSVWVYFGLREGELVPVTRDEAWLIGTSRYMWQTATGSSGPATGGAYEVKDQSFASIASCDPSRFITDIMVPPLGSVSEVITSNWWNIADPVPVPLDTSFVIGRGEACIKLKILSYEKGLYSITYQRIPVR